MNDSLQVQRTYKNIAGFNLYQPTSIDEVCTHLAKFGENCVLMAGGIDLLQELKSGRRVDNLIYLKSVPELSSIKVINDRVQVGACVTHRSLEINPIIQKHLPTLSNVWGDVGNIRVRVVGTIGGNILKNDPNYDGLPAFAALNSMASFKNISGSHRVPVASLSCDRPSGLLTNIEIPIKKKRVFSMDRTLKPIASIALSAEIDQNTIEGIRVVIGCAFSTPVERQIMENLIISSDKLTEQTEIITGKILEDLPEPLDNVFGSASYRRRIIAVLLRRQLISLAQIIR
ncbi:MAG: FAD binding domain-containing protein [Pseudomonadota bacterium]|nr:FAD binding domain-containing protein [Pseudomonadota bacterium]